MVAAAAPSSPAAKKPQPKGQVIVKSDTPIDPNDPQAAPGQTSRSERGAPGTDASGGAAGPDAATGRTRGQPATAPASRRQRHDGAQSRTPPRGFRRSRWASRSPPPQGWQQGDPTKFTVPGNICCVWSRDNISSIAIFAQNSGKPYNPRTLLEQSATGLQKSLGAEVRTKEIITVGGMRGFSLVVSGPGTGAGIDGKGTVRTDQHWVAVPRDKDVVIFLMTTPDEKFAANEAAFQTMLGSLKITGTQTPDQQAAK